MARRSLYLTIFVVMTLMGVVMSYSTVRSSPELSEFARRFTFVRGMTFWTLWGAMAPAAFYMSARFRFGAGRLPSVLVAHLTASVVFAVIHTTLAVGVALVIRALMRGEPLWPLPIFSQALGRPIVEWELTIYWALVGLAHAMAFSRDAHDRALTSARLEAELARAQVQVLQRQLQPHFLFNTLQSISALIHRDQRAADDMLGRLSELLRLTLRGTNEPEVSLERELLHTRRYLEIEQTNLGSRLRIAEDIGPGLLGAAVPSLLLQPLAENAVRHGIAPLPGGGTVRILARRDGGDLELTVADDGAGLREGPASMGIGLENTRQRLHYLYGDHQSLTVKAAEGRGVTVTVRLPFREAASTRKDVQEWAG